jgi:predicted phage tail protein
MSQLVVLGGKNGSRQIYEWRQNEIKAIERARQIFQDKLSEGYAAFKIMRASRTGQQLVGEQLHEFDSMAETIQMTPPMVGG